VICTAGDHPPGGTLWDEAIVMYLAEQFASRRRGTRSARRSEVLKRPSFLQAERGQETLTPEDKARSGLPTPASRPEWSRAAKSQRSPALLDRTRADSLDAERPARKSIRSGEDHPGGRATRCPSHTGWSPVQHGARNVRTRRGRGKARTYGPKDHHEEVKESGTERARFVRRRADRLSEVPVRRWPGARRSEKQLASR